MSGFIGDRWHRGTEAIEAVTPRHPQRDFSSCLLNPTNLVHLTPPTSILHFLLSELVELVLARCNFIHILHASVHCALLVHIAFHLLLLNSTTLQKIKLLYAS